MRIFILLLLAGPATFAWDSAKCSKMLNDGLYKKYEWGGVGDYNINAMTKETKKSGSFSGTSHITTEGTTAVSDPQYSSNVSTSQSQSTSSYGDCSMFGLKERREQRELYLVQNFDQIKRDIAVGSGSHLDSLSWFSLCDDQSKAKFNQVLQKNFALLYAGADEKAVTLNIDAVLAGDASLQKSCFLLSSLHK